MSELFCSSSVILSMSTQEWIVAVIVLLCAIEVGRRIIRFFFFAKNDDNPCANCAGGCDLKRMLDEKQHKCKGELKDNNKKCCG